jgi:hypothetical protein
MSSSCPSTWRPAGWRGPPATPPNIAFTSRTLGTDKPDIGYAMIFPSMTILKIVMVHILGAVLGVG